MLQDFLEFPFAIWLRRLVVAKYYELKYRGMHLNIGSHSLIVNCVFGKYSTIYKNVNLREVGLGDFSYISSNSRIGRTKIGKFCCIGERVECGLAGHPSKTFVFIHPVFYSTKKQSRITFADKDYFEEFKRVEIGNDVWIGNGAMIYGGVIVGDGAIIGAGALVNRDVPPYAIVGGVPAKIIRYRFNEEQIKFLVNFKWWDKDLQWLKKNYKKMHDIEELIRSFVTSQ